MPSPRKMPSTLRPIRRAILSVSDKTGLVEFAKFLAGKGVEILSTGGTAEALRKAKIRVTEVADYTGFPEMLDGRVKTLHPRVHGGLLGMRGNAAHEKAMNQNDILPIDLVVVNLYPFEATVARGAAYAECVENIDIGGPAMIRSAAKNHASVTVVVDPADYTLVREAMMANKTATTLELRRELAAKAYTRTAMYDAAISCWFHGQQGGGKWPQQLALPVTLRQELRYGENPHQKAAWYAYSGGAEGLAATQQVQGKELSYNNLNDTDAAYQLVKEFTQTAVAIIKHANPCGVAIGKTQVEAFMKALACDPTSAFGGILAFNTPLEEKTVEAIGNLFAEVIIAPGASAKAKTLLQKKKNLRLLIITEPKAKKSTGRWHVRSVSGGLLLQDEDMLGAPDKGSLSVASHRKPSKQQLEDLRFAFTVAKHVKSNAIVLAKDGATLGIGAGQMSRVDSVRISTLKAKDAGLSLKGAVLASDAFFPFADNVHLAAKAGIAALIQPGGSIRDQEVIDAANEHGMAMVLTGIRHFRH